MIDTVLKAHEADIYGIFFDISNDNVHANVVEIGPPCVVEVTFVVHSGAKVAAVQEACRKVFESEFKNPARKLDNSAPVNTDRLKEAEKQGLRLAYEVKSTDAWRVVDIERTVRFSFVDHFSGSDEAGEN